MVGSEMKLSPALYTTTFFVQILFLLGNYASADEMRSKNDLRIRNSTSVISHEIKSDAFSSSSFSKIGTGFDFSYRYTDFKELAMYRILASQNKTDFNSPDGLSPSSVSMETDRYLVDANFLWNSCSFGVGMEYRQRKVDPITLPNALLSQGSTTGIRTNVAKTVVLSDDLKADFEAGLLIPLLVYDGGPKTGYRMWSLIPDFEADLAFKVNSWTQISVGLQILYEQIAYTGAGERGTPGANESFVQYNLPLELRFNF